MSKKLDSVILIQLNEINFDFLNRQFLKKHPFPGFKKLMAEFDMQITHAENKYELLEPWIQWVSVYSGKKFEEHRVFHLGDTEQISSENWLLDKIEKTGLSIGCISPMNMPNRLKNPKFYIPDPWIKSNVSGGNFCKRVYEMLVQVVGDNSIGSISKKSFFTIIEVIFKTFRPSDFFYFLKICFKSYNRKWYKALVLDYLIFRLHNTLNKNSHPKFSTVFFNAGAHIQHHYYRWRDDKSKSEKRDPLLDMFQFYDKLLLEYIQKTSENHGLIIATGLSQEPFLKTQFYYRLKNHDKFLRKIGLIFEKVYPRMTRDFEIEFSSIKDNHKAQKLLKKCKVFNQDLALFGEFDNRVNRLFVTLTYPKEITEETRVILPNGTCMKLNAEVVFVAKKNGMHCSKGYAYFSKNCLAETTPKSHFVGKLKEKISDAVIKNVKI